MHVVKEIILQTAISPEKDVFKLMSTNDQTAHCLTTDEMIKNSVEKIDFLKGVSEYLEFTMKTMDDAFID